MIFFFLLSKKVQHTVDNKVSTLARLILYENLFIEQEKNVRCPHKRVEFRQNVRAFFFPVTKKTVRNNKVSVLSGCP